jgi:hypothetical protein
VIYLNLVLAGLRLGLKNCQVGEKWVSDDCSYLCKGLSYPPFDDSRMYFNVRYYLVAILFILFDLEVAFVGF